MKKLKKIFKAKFQFTPFSLKQKKLMTWWYPGSPHADKDGIITDGSVRAGKTLIGSYSFMLWAMCTFNLQTFGMAGKTIGALKRNVLFTLKLILRFQGFSIEEKNDDMRYWIVSKGDVSNYFYFFGALDERAQDLVQGFTAAGFFFDEAAIMPQSFVNQATARCSVEGAKSWFNCNPQGPYHWFKLEWLDKLKQKNLLHLHFVMDDNPSLSEEVKARYHRNFTGVFFKRYILGLWVMAEGIVYSMFNRDIHVIDENHELWPKRDAFEVLDVAVDYGTYNPAAFLLIGRYQKRWYVIREYYWDGRKKERQKTDDEYLHDLIKFVGDDKIRYVIVDPSAASFITLLKQNGFKVRKAKNAVLDGIRFISELLNREVLYVHSSCENLIKEFFSYTWDAKASMSGLDTPIKEFDHALDALRYYFNTLRKNTKVRNNQSGRGAMTK